MKLLLLIGLVFGVGLSMWFFGREVQKWVSGNYKFVAYTVVLLCIAVVLWYLFGVVNFNFSM